MFKYFTDTLGSKESVALRQKELREANDRIAAALTDIERLGLTAAKRRTVLTELQRQAGSTSLYDLNASIVSANQRVLEVQELLVRARAQAVQEEEITTKIGDIRGDILAACAEPVFRDWVGRQSASFLASVTKSLEPKDVEERELAVGIALRKTRLFHADMLEKKAGSIALVALRLEIDTAFRDAQGEADRITEPCAKRALLAALAAQRKAWEDFLLLTDCGAVEAGQKEIKAKLAELAGAKKKATESFKSVQDAQADVLASIDLLKVAQGSVSASKENWVRLTGTFETELERSRGAEGDLATVKAALAELKARVDAAAANAALVERGGDALVEKKVLVERSHAACERAIGMVPLPSLKSDLVPRLETLVREKDALFSSTELSTMAEGLDGLARDFDAARATADERDQYFTSVGSKQGSYLEQADALGGFPRPDTVDGLLSTLRADASGIFRLKTFAEFDEAAKRLETTSAEIERLVADVRKLATQSQAMRQEIDGLWAALRKVKPATITVPAKAELEAVDKERSGIAAVKDLTAWTAEIGKVARNLGTLKTVVGQIAARYEEGRRAEHEISISVQTIPTSSELTAFVQKRDKLLNEKAAKLAARNAGELATKLQVYNTDLGLLQVELKMLGTDKVDVGAETRRLAGLVTVLEGILRNVPEGTPDREDIATGLDNVRRTQASLGRLEPVEAKPLLFAALPRILQLIEDAKQLQFKLLLARDGGERAMQDELDAAGREEGTDVDRIYRAAIKARFGKSLKIAPGLKMKKLPKFYDLLKSVPADHVKLNEQLAVIQFNAEPKDEHNYYSSSDKRIAFNAMAEDDSPSPYQPDVGTAVNPTFYDSTTLHEVGHAVDENAKYMKSNGKKAGYGQWQEHSLPDVVKVLLEDKTDGIEKALPQVSKEALKDLLNMLLKGQAPKEPKSGDPLFAKWKDIKAHKAYVACGLMMEDHAPWYGGLERAKKLEFGNRVYQEAYAGKWVSYDLGERGGTGVSAYQWRADAEWFAEIYALYYLHPDKVPSIPLRDWLDRQTPP